MIEGPIIRIGPNEVHVKDANFHAIFTSAHCGLKKDNWMYNVGLPGATGLIVEEKKHRHHRAALATAVQPKLVNDVPYLTQILVEQLIHRLHKSQRDIFNASDAFRSVSRDLLSAIFIGQSEDLLSTPDLGHAALKLSRALFQLAAWYRQFPFLGPLAKGTPDCIIGRVVPHLPFERVSSIRSGRWLRC